MPDRYRYPRRSGSGTPEGQEVRRTGQGHHPRRGPVLGASHEERDQCLYLRPIPDGGPYRLYKEFAVGAIVHVVIDLERSEQFLKVDGRVVWAPARSGRRAVRDRRAVPAQHPRHDPRLDQALLRQRRRHPLPGLLIPVRASSGLDFRPRRIQYWDT
ncbi:MAG: hypothetical protein MZU84_05960 [Sphingobacterium sp.]|nr:hypothetical protein [Sphingobacterium sp.]